MRVISSLILTWNSYMLCAQPSNVDIMFEGYENSRLYDRWEYVLYRKHQSPAYKKVTLPPSVFLKKEVKTHLFAEDYTRTDIEGC